MGKMMLFYLEVGREVERLTSKGLEFNAALRQAKETYNIKKELPKQL
ncbi:hypothetical protein JHL18_02145 [Clostridium sp. YIM B02505]|uniref:Uncharacterized protein n=1 Tax=Clostridium yunnanense TaxID=2800325 RepID=A0ABS1EJB1_9CLOT|nr:hypothetical protein [Clostridium yunnanense]MBK1809447.1 hypothetical protein [Clostridium yunnanense]